MYYLMKLGMGSQDLQEFNLTRLDLTKSMSISEDRESNAVYGFISLRTNLGDQTSLVPSFSHV